MWSPSYTDTPSLFINEITISDDYSVFLFDSVDISVFRLYNTPLFENTFVTRLSSTMYSGPVFSLILPLSVSYFAFRRLLFSVTFIFVVFLYLGLGLEGKVT